MPEPAELVYFKKGWCSYMSIVEIKKDETGRMENIDVELYEIPGEHVDIRQTVYITELDLFIEFIKKYWRDALMILSILIIFIAAVVGLCYYHDYIWHSVPQNLIVESKLTEMSNRRFSNELKQAIKEGEIDPNKIDVTTNNGNVVITDGRISCVVTHKEYTEDELRRFGTKELRDEEAAKGYYFYYFDIIGNDEE